MMREAFIVISFGTTLASQVSAESPGNMAYQATYLRAEADWCAPDEGIPLVMTIDGPNVIEFTEELPKRITEHRGDQGRVERAFVGKKFDKNARSIGRILGEFKGCQSPWDAVDWEGSLSLVGPAGEEVLSLTSERPWVYFVPVEQAYDNAKQRFTNSEIYYGTIESHTFFTVGKVAQTRKVTVETDKEQDE